MKNLDPGKSDLRSTSGDLLQQKNKCSSESYGEMISLANIVKCNLNLLLCSCFLRMEAWSDESRFLLLKLVVLLLSISIHNSYISDTEVAETVNVLWWLFRFVLTWWHLFLWITIIIENIFVKYCFQQQLVSVAYCASVNPGITSRG